MLMPVELKDVLTSSSKPNLFLLVSEMGLYTGDDNQVSMVTNRSLEIPGYAPPSKFQYSAFFFSGSFSTPIILASG